jgi:hypothetical protein
MATVAELKSAKEAGAAAFKRGEVPSHHPKDGDRSELYEAWYDGWDEEQAKALDDHDL